MAHEVKVTLEVPEISKAAATYEIEKSGRKIGSLEISKGGIRYFPKGHSKTFIRKTWTQLHKWLSSEVTILLFAATLLFSCAQPESSLSEDEKLVVHRMFDSVERLGQVVTDQEKKYVFRLIDSIKKSGTPFSEIMNEMAQSAEVQRQNQEMDIKLQTMERKQDSLDKVLLDLENRQVEAIRNIPDEVMAKIKRDAARKNPDDYKLQEYEIRKQVESYLRLHH